MHSVAIAVGRILLIIGIAGYAYGYFGGKASITAMIPAFFGIVMLILGHLARARESMGKHLMHAAVLVAFIGFLLPAIRLISKFSEISFTAAYISQIAMSLTCLAFVILAVRSFMVARANA